MLSWLLTTDIAYDIFEKIEPARRTKEKRTLVAWNILVVPKSVDTTSQLQVRVPRSSSAKCALILEGYQAANYLFKLPDTFSRNFHRLRQTSPLEANGAVFSHDDLCWLVRKSPKFSHKFIGDWGVTCIDTSRASPEHVATRIRSWQSAIFLEQTTLWISLTRTFFHRFFRQRLRSSPASSYRHFAMSERKSGK